MEHKLHKPSLHADWIDHDAREIVYRLQQAGFESYLVGGCVRDLLAGLHPKDYDIATLAKPNDVRRLIRGAYVIGRRFRLVLVKRGETQFEVATFRRNAQAEDLESEDEVVGDNFFGTPEEDAQRRDFTVNALFYDPVKNDLVDFISGVADVESGIIRMIGNPDERLKEDPIRILRAVRFAHKLKFSLDPDLKASMRINAEEMVKSVLPRKREEYLKILRLEDPFLAFQELHDLGVLKFTLPFLDRVFENPDQADAFRLILRRAKEIVPPEESTLDLYWPFVQFYAELRPNISAAELFSAGFEQFLRDELGLFKSEISGLFNLYDLQRPLKQIEYFKRKGYRRQRAFLERENIKMAFWLAQKTFQLTPHEVLFWKEFIQ